MVSEEEGFFALQSMKTRVIVPFKEVVIGRFSTKLISELPDSPGKTIIEKDNDALACLLSNADESKGFVSLGQSKTVSREHVKIAWNPDTSQWELICLGKNGISVDKEQIDSSSPPLPLESKAAIRIGAVFLFFLLPKD